MGHILHALAMSAACLATPALAQDSHWTGTGWPSGVTQPRAFETFDDGTGLRLYATSRSDPDFSTGWSAVVRTDGNGWEPAGQPVAGRPTSLLVHDDGSGPRLYAGGLIQVGDDRFGAAALDDGQWIGIASLDSGSVNALASLDTGDGPRLIAGGVFTAIGGVSAGNIAQWDGQSWSPLGEGPGGDVGSMQVFDDGSGPALYAAVSLAVDGSPRRYWVARWDGASWSQVGPELSFLSNTFAVFDDGTGPALYAAGRFEQDLALARLDGTDWTTIDLGFELRNVLTLYTFNNGETEQLLLGGSQPFGTAIGMARWDGTRLSGLPPMRAAGYLKPIYAFGSLNGTLYFSSHDQHHTSYCTDEWYYQVGKIVDGPASACDAEIGCDGVLDIIDLNIFLSELLYGDSDGIDLNRDLRNDFSDLLIYLERWQAGCSAR